MNFQVHIVVGPLGQAVAWAAPAGSGAVVCFEGIARPTEDGRPITALDYEAYQPMAQNMLDRIGREVMARYALLGLCVEHSVGRVAVGACSFRLRVAAPHRKEALAAMDQFIDRLKKDVPIWKMGVTEG